MKKLKCNVWGMLRYADLLLCVFLLWWFFRSYLFFLMLILALFAPVVSVWVLVSRQENLSVKAELPGGRIGRNHAVGMKLWAENRNRFLSFYAELHYRIENLFTEYVVEEKEQIWIGPGSSQVAERKLTSLHMGRLEVRFTKFVLYDWLHLCRLESAACQDAGVMVCGGMQETAEEPEACVEGFPQENELQKRGIDINPDYEVREYIPGDDLKSIHWKLTAKQGRIMVRERLAAGRDKINVLLPLTGNEQENDGLVEALQGLGLLLLNRGYPVRLCWLGKGDALVGRYLAEPGELENAVDEILSGSGRKDPGLARSRMEEQYPGESYIMVRNGAYKGEYIR